MVVLKSRERRRSLMRRSIIVARTLEIILDTNPMAKRKKASKKKAKRKAKKS